METLQKPTQKNSDVSACLNCGSDFVPKRSDQKNCCRKCAAQWHNSFYYKQRALGQCSVRYCERKPVENRTTCTEHLEAMNKRRAGYTRSYKEQALDAYGGRVCVGCDETDFCCLSIDHIAQDGHLHREEQGGCGTAFYLWLKRNKYPDGFRVLCMNCQFRARMHEPFPNVRRRRDSNVYGEYARGYADKLGR
jgi:hypothetical protein